jgi:hypothetical protein
VDTVTLEEFCSSRRIKRRSSKFTLSSRGSSTANLGDVFEFSDLQVGGGRLLGLLGWALLGLGA